MALSYFDSRKIEGLSGPSSFYFYKNAMGKRILLLGEIHRNINLCNNENYPDVHHWLLKLIANAPKNECIDLFVESPYYLKDIIKHYQTIPIDVTDMLERLKKKETDDFLLKLIKYIDSPKYFVKVLQGFSRKPQLPFRFHNINTNMILHPTSKKKLNNPLIHIYLGYVKMIEWLPTESIQKKYVNKLESKLNTLNNLFTHSQKIKIIQYLLHIDNSNEAKELYIDLFMKFYETIVSRSLFQRIFKKIGLKTESFLLKKKYIQKMNDYLNALHPIIEKELSKLSPLISKDKLLTILSKFYEKLLLSNEKEYDLFFILSSISMDIYTICRLFIQFNKSKMKRSSTKECANTLEPKNVIIYTDFLHTQLYHLFLEELGYKPDLDIDYIPNKKLLTKQDLYSISQCIEFEKPFDYFS